MGWSWRGLQWFVREVRASVRAGPRRRRHTQHPNVVYVEMFEFSRCFLFVSRVSQTATPRVLDIDTAQPVAQNRSCKAVHVVRPPGGRAALA